ncbi:Rpp14/Pop5 family protein [Candidatus Nanohalovita haloferacivicina]|uniref:Rpp14/Pop5 family protein n=1 Tax=Candidatus Nanohalovita haloferacivicina TaxID=2978046 RepID=UPI00325FA1B3|nr:Ribonuclease P/MRP protein subunit POP5 [Candidatus Nanohalobia archaeon BNXNv]
MKHLPPTLREDNRYIRYKIHSETAHEFPEVVDSIWDAVLGYLGEKQASKANPWIIKNLFDEQKQQGAIRINRETETDVRAALIFIDEIVGEEAFVTVEQVAGTVKSLEGLEE